MFNSIIIVMNCNYEQNLLITTLNRQRFALNWREFSELNLLKLPDHAFQDLVEMMW